MKVLSVVGARPQFIKASALSRLIRRHHTEILVHTGQHYDRGMSDVFFEELGMPAPEINLGVGSASHAVQTADMMCRLEPQMVEHQPDWVLLYGDTNSTIAGALVAAKLGLRVAHVEAGLRSFDRRMPEEINRVVTDHLSSLLLCPSQSAVDNLAVEGIHDGVAMVGDVMADVLRGAAAAAAASRILERLGLSQHQYAVATLHRAENTDDLTRLEQILGALRGAHIPVVLPLHPRTRARLVGHDASGTGGALRMIDPVGYHDMVKLVGGARMVLTDSGGLQKEAYWLGVPCVTLRDQTEWTETVAAGWNILTGADPGRIAAALSSFVPPAERPSLYGDGRAAERVVAELEHYT